MILFPSLVPRALLSRAGRQWPSPRPHVPTSPRPAGGGAADGGGWGTALPPTRISAGSGFSLCFKIPFFPRVPNSKQLILGLTLFLCHVPPGPLGWPWSVGTGMCSGAPPETRNIGSGRRGTLEMLPGHLRVTSWLWLLIFSNQDKPV